MRTFTLVVDSLVQLPGPKSDSRTGSRMTPCKAPSVMTKKIILKNVMKIYEGANASPRTPRMVERAPWAIGSPSAYRDVRMRPFPFNRLWPCDKSEIGRYFLNTCLFQNKNCLRLMARSLWLEGTLLVNQSQAFVTRLWFVLRLEISLEALVYSRPRKQANKEVIWVLYCAEYK